MDSSASATETPPLTMRYARVDDAEAIGHNHHKAWVEGFAGLLPSQGLADLDVNERIQTWTTWLEQLEAEDASEFGQKRVVVALRADTIVAHLMVQEATILQLYVHPDCWRQGIGKELLTVAERIIKNAGHAEAELFTLAESSDSIAFYESAGWTLDGTSKSDTLWGMEIDEVRMTKSVEAQGHVVENRGTWNAKSVEYAAYGRNLWAKSEPVWGELSIPDAYAKVMPDVEGKDVVELGCGTGYVSAWCSRLGAKSVVGIDNSPLQLATAQALQEEFNLSFPLIQADAEQAPLAAARFDVAISEYGAAIWCDPHRWIPEAARLLRPGGLLVFLANSTLSMLVVNDFLADAATAAMVRPLRGFHRHTWPDDDGVEFHVSHGEQIRILCDSGFEVLDLIELYPPPGHTSKSPQVSLEWAENWPAEEVWVARLRG